MTRTGRLLDSEKQIEILFEPKLTFICTIINNAYKLTGIPDNYLVFGENIEKYFPPMLQKKFRNKRQTKSYEIDQVFLRAWGHITPLSLIPINDYEAREYVVTISITLKPLQLRPCVPLFNQAIWEKTRYIYWYSTTVRPIF